jgi:hypothetical protein
MSRILKERWLIADKNLGVFPANQAVFVEIDGQYGLNPAIRDGHIVLFNADTGVTVGAGITAATVPNLTIAQGVDTDGDGIADVLRYMSYKKINTQSLVAATAEGPSCGQIKIVDVGIGCVERGKSYSLTIEVRNEEYERLYDQFRGYERFTETVEFDFDKCTNCDQPLDCKEVACALANKFNGKDRNYSLKKNISLLKRVREHQDKDKPFHVYVLHENDYEFCFTTNNVACVGCTEISAITGAIVDGVTHNFIGTTTVDGTATNVNQIEKVIKNLNRVLGDKGYALNASTFSGSAKPCCDGVKLLVNACVPVQLLGEGGTPIAPCATGLPTYNVVTQGSCGSCSASTTITPCAYLRIVPKPIKIDKFCDGPDNWLKTLYTDIRVTTSYNHNNFGFFREFVKQDYKIPRGLVYELQHRVLLQDPSMNEPFSWGYDERAGNYRRLIPGSRTLTMGKGLFDGCDSADTVCIYNFEHDGITQDTFVAANTSNIHFRTLIAVPSSNVAFKTEFEAIINPWLISLGKSFKSITCSVDQDQIERVLNPDFTVNAEEYPNANDVARISAG